MTTRFDSFDESAIGDFVESPVGARNTTSPPGFIFVFVDESEMDPGTYAEDRTLTLEAYGLWNTFRAAYPHVQLHVGHTGGGPIWHPGIGWPVDVGLTVIGTRPGDVEALHFLELLATHDPDDPSRLDINIDISGSISSVLSRWTNQFIVPRLPMGIEWRSFLFGVPETWLHYALDNWISTSALQPTTT